MQGLLIIAKNILDAGSEGKNSKINAFLTADYEGKIRKSFK